MMVGGGDFRSDGERAGGLCRFYAFALLLAVLFVAGGMRSPAAAQQGWAPTVATSPGGTLHAPLPGEPARTPLQIDPRYFPSPRDTAPQPRNPLPQGVWSPIVTGALPQHPGPAGPEPGVGVRVMPNQIVPPLAVAPANPAPRQAVAAAGSDSAKAAPAAPAGASPGVAAGATDNPLFKKPGPLDALPPNATAAQQYCFNTADTAADARFAWQAKKIQEMEAELEKRAQQLEAKTEEYKTWLARRDEFSRKAHEKLVGFYSRMRPDAAASQLASLDEETAAAVVTKLETKVASAIMGEMNPEQAAKIAAVISGAAKVPSDRKRAARQTDNKPPGDTAGPADQASQPEPRS